jgi:catalase
MMPPDQRQALFENTARAIAWVPDEIRQRHIDVWEYVEPANGDGVETVTVSLK